uniref:Si:dkey-65b12.6 n=1 Tax=Erpetoichthys calabaricus TaxID=27687 RepID=A0A8C4XFL6_ERPCA
GTEFVTVFMNNHLPQTAKASFKLAFTAHTSAANVRVQMKSDGFVKELQMNKGQTRQVSLPQSAEIINPGLTNKTVIITSDSPISVVSFNRKLNSGDSSRVFPIQDLGSQYIVLTPKTGRSGMKKLAAIINGKQSNIVDIYPKRRIRLDGVHYDLGTTLTITLPPYETFQLESSCSLTGTRIVARKPIAVLAGHHCSSKTTYCQHVYEQLVPVSRFATQFMVAPLSEDPSADVLYVVASEENTLVNCSDEVGIKTKTLNAGETMVATLSNSVPMAIVSSKKVMVMYYSGKNTLDSYLLTVTPTTEFSQIWALDTQASFDNSAVIVAKKDGNETVTLNHLKLPDNSNWHKFDNNLDFLWTKIALGTQRGHFLINSNYFLAVYVYGLKTNNAYGTTGTCLLAISFYVLIGNPYPCSNMKCRPKEKCENGTCVPLSNATCCAVGDSLYKTFDGKIFDFHGTCSYTLAKSNDKDASIIPFFVTVKNYQQVTTAKHFIFFISLKTWSLPLDLQSGQIKVYHSQDSIFVDTAIGLHVLFDWDNNVFLTIPSTYFKSVEGLCGNYNENMNDDLKSVDGSTALSIVDFVSSWKVEDDDLFCQNDCTGSCPVCYDSLQRKYSSEDYCGLMGKKEGPFENCHLMFQPKMYVSNCIYDMCVNNGYMAFLCQAMKTYAETCQKAGAKVLEWRSLTNCSMDCPFNSHYELCGNACPASCGKLDAPSKCKLPCAEICQCDEGYVLSNGKCELKENCGCYYEGIYLISGETFLTDKCEEQCTCNSTTGDVTCVPYKCKTSEICDFLNGVRTCLTAVYSTCVTYGNPHYVTFDGKAYDFHGTCVYQFSKLISNDSSLTFFDVQIQNENHGKNNSRTYTTLALITILNNEIVIRKDSPGNVLVNNITVTLPFYIQGKKISIFKSGLFAVIQTTFGLRVTFNWENYIAITLPSSYSGTVGGLCGNLNGNRDDDLMTRNNLQMNNPADFGRSWLMETVTGCSNDCQDTCPTCDINVRNLYESKEFCGILTDETGPFKDCHTKVDANIYLGNCVYDLCLYNGQADALCQALTAYTAICQNVGVKISGWRTEKMCPLDCKANSHYNVCASGCPMTCYGFYSPPSCEGAPCKEGCACDDGFFLSGDNCVSQAECGCVYRDQYYKINDVFFSKGMCFQKCLCHKGGNVTCDKGSECGPHERCELKDGVPGCHPTALGTCWISGSSRFKSFDGRNFNLLGNCSYKVAEFSLTDNKLAKFSIVMHRVTVRSTITIKSLDLKLYNYTVTLLANASWQIMVGGVKIHLPLILDGGQINVYQSGFNIILKTNFGLVINYDGASHAVFNIPSTYIGVLSGLCGNYNEDMSDDFQLPSGEQAANEGIFAAGWKANFDRIACQTGCGSKCPVSKESRKPEVSKNTACGILNLKTGPFGACHTKVSPQEYFDNCVKDMITNEASKALLCENIQTYAHACQDAATFTGEWRTDKLCPVTCPANSHYELCTDSCTATCVSLSATIKCPHCHEGCQCNDGFVFDGKSCVTKDKCGCFIDGVYFMNGEVMFHKSCSEKCTCDRGNFTCEEASCAYDEVCEARRGVMACYIKGNPHNPCSKLKCHVKENCVISEDTASCVPQSNASCWAIGEYHYKTFDGVSFNFPGTCAYILAQKVGTDSTLTRFSVVNKNTPINNSSESLARMVTVTVYGHTVAIVRDERGKIRVSINGSLTKLPVKLDSGKIAVSQSGMKAILETDFGLLLTFDWRALLSITVPSSYYDSLGGLCGNYNENKDDDYTVRGGNVTTNITAWAISWTISENDPTCLHTCQGDCPTCSNENQAQFGVKSFCGIVTQKDGPFRQCHTNVPPYGFFENCLFDMCISQGKKAVLCDFLNSYAAICQSAGASISSDWRKISSCTLECPSNSRYEFCGSACPVTCAERTVPDNCQKPCTETCQCNKGFVLSAGLCVSESKCGCFYNGQYHEPGETFWADKKCLQYCLCDQSTHSVTCQQNSCKENEQCKTVYGVHSCHTVTYKSCIASDNAHFLTFDGMDYDYLGTCVYRMAAVCAKDPSLKMFDIAIQNNNKRSPQGKFTKVLSVKVYNMTFNASQDINGKIMVNGIVTSLPFSLDTKTLSVQRSDTFCILETNFGLKVSFDWNQTVIITVPDTYSNTLCGLCGNNNGNKDDDMQLADGQAAPTLTDFAESHKVEDVLGCASLIIPVTPPIAASCAIIVETSGPLNKCISKVNATQYHSSCVEGVILQEGEQKKAACDTITSYVIACQEAKGTIFNWRNTTFCPPLCPRNSEYQICAPGCPVTCQSLSSSADCNSTCKEDCQCIEGFVLNNDTCEPLATCGCNYEQQHYTNEEVFLSDDKCSQRCTCKDNIVTCKDFSCGPHKTCKLVNGIRGCYPSGSASCMATGDSHFRTFDNRSYDFHGVCNYTVANVTGTRSELTKFSVQLNNVHMDPGKISETYSVTVEVYGYSITILNGNPKALPFTLEDGKINGTQDESTVVVQTDFGLTVKYDLVNATVVTVPATYIGQMAGLCGNYNESPDDDLSLPNGEAASNVSDFGAAWAVGKNNEDCGEVCQDGVCLVVDKEEQKKAGKCDLIIATKGPLAECHSVVPPDGFLENCMRDSNASRGELEMICLGIQAYVKACQDAKIMVQPWRTHTFCGMCIFKENNLYICNANCTHSLCHSPTHSLFPILLKS